MRATVKQGQRKNFTWQQKLQLKRVLPGMLLVAMIPMNAQEWQYNGLRNTEQKEAGFIGSEGGNWPQALAVSSDGEFLMMGTDVAGLIRTDNGGNLWEQANAGYTPRGNCALAIDPNNANKVLAVGGNSVPSLIDKVYNGVHLSKDKGKTWNQVVEADVCGYRDIREQVVWDASSFDAAIGGSAIAYWSRAGRSFCNNLPDRGEVLPGLYKSEDGGENWVLLPNSAAYGQSILKVHPTEGFVYAAREDGFYKSTDGGATFTLKEPGNMTGMDVVPTQPNNVYLSKADGIYLSNDAGETFTQITATNYPPGAFFIKVSPANTNRMMIQQEAEPFFNPWFYSEDGGVTWTESFIDDALAFLPQNRGKKLYPIWHPTDENIVWTSGGDWITQSTDGGKNFVFKNNGNSMITQTGFLNFSVENPDIVVVTNQDYNAAITTTRGDTYKYLNTSGKSFGGFAYGGYSPDGKTIFVRNSPGSNSAPRELVISFDGGESFNMTGIVSGGRRTGYSDPENKNIFFLGDLRSEDAGLTWSTMADCDGVFTHNRSDSGELLGIKGTSVVSSMDSGLTWSVIFTSESGQELEDMAHDQINDIFYAVSKNHLYKYERVTQTLTDITNNTPIDQLDQRRVFNTVAVDPVVTDIVYTGSSKDVYATDVAINRSLDRGQTFIPLTKAPRHGNVDGGLDAGREVTCVRVHPVTREAWVGCGVYGLWKIPAPNGNVPPTIDIKGTFEGAFYEQPFETDFEVNAADSDGSIDRVEFYIDGQKVFEDVDAPYSFPLRLDQLGTFVVQARAFDNEDVYTSSEEVSFTIAPSGTYAENFDDGEAQDWNFSIGTWEVVGQELTTPEITGNKTAIYEGADFTDFTYELQATPSIGNEYGVYFQYQNSDNYFLLRIDPNPKEFKLTKNENGTLTEIALGTYSNGGVRTSNSVKITYQENKVGLILSGETVLEDIDAETFASGKIGLFANFNSLVFDNILVTPLVPISKAPVVTITSPEDGAVFQQGEAVTLQAEVQENNAPIAKVEFFLDSTKVGEKTAAPYDFVLNALKPGSNAIEVVATDEEGITGSDQISINIASEGLYLEDFNDGIAQGWKAIRGDWAVVDSIYNTAEVIQNKLAVNDSLVFENFIYTVEATPRFQNAYGLVFNYSDTENYTFVRVSINPKEVSLITIANGTQTVLATETYEEGTNNEKNTLAVKNENGETTVTLNNVLILDAIATSDQGAGNIGLYASFNPVVFDNVQVQSTDTPERSSIGEIGKSEGNHTWTTVELERNFENPIVITSPLSTTGSQPATVRVRNVTGNSFQWRVDEWEYLDEIHLTEEIYYLVVERGVHELENGTTLQAGTARASSTFNTQILKMPFNSAPILLTQVSTENEAEAVVVSVKNVSPDSFRLKLSEEERGNPSQKNGNGQRNRDHIPETISWLAIESGSANGIGTDFFEAVKLPAADIHTPWTVIDFLQTYFNDERAFFADIQTVNGIDPVNLRRRRNVSNGVDSFGQDKIQLFAQEEQSRDFETNHAPEAIGYLVFNGLGSLMGYTFNTENPSNNRSTLAENSEAIASGETLTISVATNPIKDKTVELSFFGLDIVPREPFSLLIYDLSGNLIVEQALISAESVTVPVEKLGKGVYIMKLALPSENKAFKLLVD
ncbi:Ig-like domain-containing protein [Maribacter sp. 2307ULW6-5]|uniref:Ig-like domain-containing protein n=1 Tax=Maribacter sp. 2307ULW6-5 TaxID=3386275 RepID=UPI0039BD37CA